MSENGHGNDIPTWTVKPKSWLTGKWSPTGSSRTRPASDGQICAPQMVQGSIG
jgi:hypothetical protein